MTPTVCIVQAVIVFSHVVGASLHWDGVPSAGPFFRPILSVSRDVPLFICLSPPSVFYLGLLFALRSHDRFKASHWSTLLPYPLVLL